MAATVPFLWQRRVEFCETDAAGIVHFSVYFQYMEQAEHALLRELGLSVHCRDGEGLVSWPRVHADCDFVGAARFEELLTVAVWVERLGRRSVTYRFRISRDKTELATGQMTSVCCQVHPEAAPVSIEIPAAIRERLLPLVAAP